MSWAAYHAQSERFAGLAEVAVFHGDIQRAIDLYRQAAEQETEALKALDSGKTRTLAITVVSAAALWFKAREFEHAQAIAYQGLATGALPAFAVTELKDLLQLLWNEEALARAGVQFSRNHVLCSVSGGQVVRGGAPLDLIIRKVDEVSRLFFRTIEWLFGQPFRRRGMPAPEIQEQFRPWLFQAPAGSYQFAVRVQRPLQMSLFPEDAPTPDQITDKFLEIVRTSIADPDEALKVVVPDSEYRDVFLKLTRNLTPRGTIFNRMEIRPAGDVGAKAIILVPEVRDSINQTIRTSRMQRRTAEEQREVQIRGVLRGLHLDNDWLEIHELEGEQRTIRIVETGDLIDDVVGPMVNQKVTVTAIERSSGRYAFRDIQTEE